MAEARTANSEFKRVYGNAKKQASELAEEASDAAQEVYEHAATRSKRSPIPQWRLRSGSAGYSAVCTDRSESIRTV